MNNEINNEKIKELLKEKRRGVALSTIFIAMIIVVTLILSVVAYNEFFKVTDPNEENYVKTNDIIEEEGKVVELSDELLSKSLFAIPGAVYNEDSKYLNYQTLLKDISFYEKNTAVITDLTNDEMLKVAISYLIYIDEITNEPYDCNNISLYNETFKEENISLTCEDNYSLYKIDYTKVNETLNKLYNIDGASFSTTIYFNSNNMCSSENGIYNCLIKNSELNNKINAQITRVVDYTNFIEVYNTYVYYGDNKVCTSNDCKTVVTEGIVDFNTMLSTYKAKIPTYVNKFIKESDGSYYWYSIEKVY